MDPPRSNCTEQQQRGSGSVHSAAAAHEVSAMVTPLQASFVGTFLVLPKFKEALKEPVDWRDMFAELSQPGVVKSITPAEAYAKSKRGGWAAAAAALAAGAGCCLAPAQPQRRRCPAPSAGAWQRAWRLQPPRPQEEARRAALPP
jgi:hypothetical protein